jgi:hypothetical protein
MAFAVAGYVAWANSQSDSQVFHLMGMELLAGPDLEDQGRMTWQVLVVFGVFTLGLALRSKRS